MCRKASVYAGFGKNKKKIEKTFKKVLTSYGKRSEEHTSELQSRE